MSSIEVNSELVENGDQALIAIIDEGIDIFHDAFLDKFGNTRIIEVWDQTDFPNATIRSLGIPGSPESFGRVHTKEDLDKYIAERKQAGSTPSTLMRNFFGIKHGTKVASIAAGSRINDFSGIAPESRIIVVIPLIHTNPNFETAYDLALRYIKKIATTEPYQNPVVINISQGLNLEGHDGTSLIEKSCDRFSSDGKEAGLIIVKSAGNERDKKNHAKLRARKNHSSFLTWESKEKFRGRDRIGLWFNKNNLMKFKLINPSGDDKAPWVCQNNTVDYKFDTSDKFQMSYEDDGRLLITIKPGSDDQVIETGTWKLEIVGIFLEYPDDSIHAWIEYLEGRTQKRVIQFINYIDEEITLTIPGTSKTVITVGSVNSSDSLNSSCFSSLGPTRDDREQPILATVGEQVAVATAGTSSEVGADSGTSFAAPKVTGVIALLLSARKKQCEKDPNLKQFNATEIKEILIGMTSDPTISWNSAIGYGVLDIEKLIANLDVLTR